MLCRQESADERSACGSVPREEIAQVAWHINREGREAHAFGYPGREGRGGDVSEVGDEIGPPD